jgi:hypothetical protein
MNEIGIPPPPLDRPVTDERSPDVTDNDQQETSVAVEGETTADRTESEQQPEQLTLATFHDACQQAGRPVLTAASVAQSLEIPHETASDALEELANHGEVERLSVETDPVVWYPSELEDLTDRERVVVFPKRREIIVDRPEQFTRAQLSQLPTSQMETERTAIGTSSARRTSGRPHTTASRNSPERCDRRSASDPTRSRSGSRASGIAPTSSGW